MAATEVIVVRVTADVLAELRAAAGREKVSLSEFVRRAASARVSGVAAAPAWSAAAAATPRPAKPKVESKPEAGAKMCAHRVPAGTFCKKCGRA